MKAWLKLGAAASLCCAAAAGGQTLARRNWAGSGITVEPWYQSAIFYQIDPLTFQDSNGDGFGDLAGITARLPYLEQLGVDAIVLSPLPLDPPGGAHPFDPTYGSEDDFDLLERETNTHKMRLLVDLDLDTPREQLLATARFWLSRGVAGLRLAGSSKDRAPVLRELRAIAGPSRIFIAEGPEEPAVASRHPAPRARPDLLLDRGLTVAQPLTATLLRAALTGRNLLSDVPNKMRSLTRLGDGTHDVAIARITAAALLLGRGAPLLYFGQELGMSGTGDPTPMQWDGTVTGNRPGSTNGFSSAAPWVPVGPNATTANAKLEDADQDSLLNWYRKLARLHHAEAAVRTGSLELLRTADPGLVAWLRRPAAGPEPPVLALVNLSPFAKVIPLSSLLPARAATLKPLAYTSTDVESSKSVNAIAIDGFGVYVGEVRQGPGLESVVLPARVRRHR